MSVSPKETPEDILYSAPCYAFLPDSRLNSQEALTKCLAALEAEHGAGVDSAELKRLVCQIANADGSDVPAWKLEATVNGSSASATIHAVTAQRL